MIIMCPFCGHQLPRPLSHGMSSCINCSRVFDSSEKNELLSMSWLARKKNIDNWETLVGRCQASEENAKFVIQHVVDGCCNHEEFSNIVNEVKFNKKAS